MATDDQTPPDQTPPDPTPAGTHGQGAPPEPPDSAQRRLVEQVRAYEVDPPAPPRATTGDGEGGEH